MTASLQGIDLERAVNPGNYPYTESDSVSYMSLSGARRQCARIPKPARLRTTLD